MKAIILICITISSFLTLPAYAVEFWHSNTVWAGQGQCSAVFSFDSEMNEIIDLQLSVSAFNQVGEEVASGVIEIAHFGQSSADRYIDAYLESEAFCDEQLTILVKDAQAIVDGQPINLLKSKMISARDFKPFNIRMAQ
ncbi:hypothetical protein CAG54_03120 [Vibrio sp. V27_P1S3P104]|uniref:IrmA family protein n=1 Tax=Vibrio TaxID=662 RepID=UPI000C17364E|nr:MULTISPECIES: IrmA family protein [Vibrio]NAW67814.1 hypothetical protein [Vibrio sp. V28_P6S34P95]NAX04151.1 hypothetical protein [Vibrio sp. V30_P3S12P165]NAX36511.1 hypothetical protein [Vibrio sp. V27_P1S3P104]NNN45084.1 hypothetical protein [Vibrio sp. 1-1(7)]NNN72457.1 hypothetical protein [Vibrio sp. 12-2(3-a)]